MPGPELPNKATWGAFKKSRNDFESGTCGNCKQPSDKLIWHGLLLVCTSCREWLEKNRRA